MANFESGVRGYVKAQATVTVYFPIDLKGNVEIACKHCEHYVSSLRKCGLNQKIVNYPERCVGVSCPLEQVEVNENV